MLSYNPSPLPSFVILTHTPSTSADAAWTRASETASRTRSSRPRRATRTAKEYSDYQCDFNSEGEEEAEGECSACVFRPLSPSLTVALLSSLYVCYHDCFSLVSVHLPITRPFATCSLFTHSPISSSLCAVVGDAEEGVMVDYLASHESGRAYGFAAEEDDDEDDEDEVVGRKRGRGRRRLPPSATKSQPPAKRRRLASEADDNSGAVPGSAAAERGVSVVIPSDDAVVGSARKRGRPSRGAQLASLAAAAASLASVSSGDTAGQGLVGAPLAVSTAAGTTSTGGAGCESPPAQLLPLVSPGQESVDNSCASAVGNAPLAAGFAANTAATGAQWGYTGSSNGGGRAGIILAPQTSATRGLPVPGSSAVGPVVNAAFPVNSPANTHGRVELSANIPGLSGTIPGSYSSGAGAMPSNNNNSSSGPSFVSAAPPAGHHGHHHMPLPLASPADMLVGQFLQQGGGGAGHKNNSPPKDHSVSTAPFMMAGGGSGDPHSYPYSSYSYSHHHQQQYMAPYTAMSPTPSFQQHTAASSNTGSSSGPTPQATQASRPVLQTSTSLGEPGTSDHQLTAQMMGNGAGGSDAIYQQAGQHHTLAGLNSTMLPQHYSHQPTHNTGGQMQFNSHANFPGGWSAMNSVAYPPPAAQQNSGPSSTGEFQAVSGPNSGGGMFQGVSGPISGGGMPMQNFPGGHAPLLPAHSLFSLTPHHAAHGGGGFHVSNN